MQFLNISDCNDHPDAFKAYRAQGGDLYNHKLTHFRTNIHILLLFAVCFNISCVFTQGSDDLERFLKLRADELADNGFGLYLMLGANKGQSKSNHIRR